jgi:RNA polymerase sigma-70 factor (ECF subfamily)
LFVAWQISVDKGHPPAVMLVVAMNPDPLNLEELVRRAGTGDERALAELYHHYRPRLRQMVRLRLDRRLAGRLDPSDVLQEAYLECGKRLKDYSGEMPFFVWLRFLTGQKLVDLHRRHLGTRMRDAGQEISLVRGPFPQASSASLAQQLLGRLTTPSQAAQRVELQVQMQEALNNLDPLDREVLTLRHFESLSNEETAAVLGLKKSAASNRYVRALQRLKAVLESLPGGSNLLS